MFLDYGGDKEFIVRGYANASFDTNPDDSKYQSGCVLKVGAISKSSSMQSIVDIEICEINTDLNVTVIRPKRIYNFCLLYASFV